MQWFKSFTILIFCLPVMKGCTSKINRCFLPVLSHCQSNTPVLLLSHELIMLLYTCTLTFSSTPALYIPHSHNLPSPSTYTSKLFAKHICTSSLPYLQKNIDKQQVCSTISLRSTFPEEASTHNNAINIKITS